LRSVSGVRGPGKADFTILKAVKSGPKRYKELLETCRSGHVASDNTTVDYSLKKLFNLRALEKEGGCWVKGPKFDEIFLETCKKLAENVSVPTIYCLEPVRKSGKLTYEIRPLGSDYRYHITGPLVSSETPAAKTGSPSP